MLAMLNEAYRETIANGRVIGWKDRPFPNANET